MGVQIVNQVCENCNRTCSVSVINFQTMELGNCPYCNHKQSKINDGDSWIPFLVFVSGMIFILSLMIKLIRG
jgi:hypothetical protein